MHNVRSRWNVGSFFRTADAFNVACVYLTGYTPAPPSIVITKTAIGAEKIVPFHSVQSIESVLQKLHAEKACILALEQSNESISLHSYVTTSKVIALIVGNELTGISREIIDACESSIEIPMLGSKESLNVSVAAGIALHHLRYCT